MSLKFLAPLAVLLGVIGGGTAWSGAQSTANVSCCVPGAACCNPPQECCFTDSKAATDCCASGEACCASGEACCLTAAQAK